MLALETALPIKFEESIIEAIGIKPQRPSALKDIELLDQEFEVFNNDVEAIKSFIRENT